MTVDRARAFISKHAPKRGRRRGAGGGGGAGILGIGSFGAGGGLFEAGTVAVIGGVVLARMLTLPAWMSPIGGALYLYGWYKKNTLLKTLGVFVIAMGLVGLMGIPEVIGQKIDQLRAGGLKALTSGGGRDAATDAAADRVANQ